MNYFGHLTILFLFSSLYLTEQFNRLGNMLIALLIISFFIIAILKLGKIKINTISLILMSFYVLFCSLSALYNQDFKLILNAIIMFILYLVAIAIIPSFKNLEINKQVYKAVLLSQFPIIIIPIFVTGFYSIPYKGIFYNPNSFGSVVATLFVTLFSVFIFYIERLISKDKKIGIKLLAQLLILFFLLILIILSGSRTSVLTVGLIVGLGFIFLTLNFIRFKSIVNFIKRGVSLLLGCLLIVIVLIKFTPFTEFFHLNIIEKFQRKIERGDILDHRGQVWLQTIQDAGLLGRGSQYFLVNTEVGAHNTFISILGENGWLALIVFCLFIFFAYISAFRYTKYRRYDPYKYLPLMLLFCFTLLSMGEGMLYKLSMLAMFFSLGSTVVSKS